MEENEITDHVIYGAALELQTAIALECGRLADKLLGRPELGSPEWIAEQGSKNTPEGQARLREWHLLKIRIEREAKVSMDGDVVNARKHGATWQAIGAACGISRQAAFDRWAKYTTLEGDAR